MKKAHAEPLDASYKVDMTINGMKYVLKIQPENRCRMAALQALRIDRDEDGPHFELITSGNLPSSLLEIFIYQGVK